MKHQNGRSLVGVSEVLIAAVLGAELQGAQDAEVNKTSLVFPG